MRTNPCKMLLESKIWITNTTKSREMRESSGRFRVFREISCLSWSKCPPLMPLCQ